MPAPPLVSYVETVWNTKTASKVSPAFAVLAGDYVLALVVSDSTGVPFPLISATGLTWTGMNPDSPGEPLIVTGSGAAIFAWSAPVEADDAALTVTVSNMSASFDTWGMGVAVVRDSAGSGSVVYFSHLGSTPGQGRVNIQTSQPSSLVVPIMCDGNGRDGADRIWLENAGALTELTYHRSTSVYTVYLGCHENVRRPNLYETGVPLTTLSVTIVVAIEMLANTPDSPPLENVDYTEFPKEILRTPALEELNLPDEGIVGA